MRAFRVGHNNHVKCLHAVLRNIDDLYLGLVITHVIRSCMEVDERQFKADR